FAFLKDTVIKELDKENEFVDSSEALSERSLRRLENVSPRSPEYGLSFRGPNDKLLQLSPSSILQGLESRSPKALDGGVLEEAYVLPDEQASALQEICFNHLPTLTLWTGIDVPEEDYTEAEKKMCCHDVLKEVYERLEQDFAEADSSLLLKHWVDLEPNGYVWSRFCSEERLRAAQGFSNQVIATVDGDYRFEPVRPDFGRYGQGSAAHGTVPSKDTKNGRDTTRKHGQKNNAFSSESKTSGSSSSPSTQRSPPASSSTSGTLGGNKSSGSKPGKRAEYCFDFFETGSCKYGANWYEDISNNICGYCGVR
ncbi:hypothetical protein FOZ60_006376, partial [Perkinsus olseni]